MKVFNLSLMVLISAVAHGTQVTNFVYGDCKAGKDSCGECFQTLVKCLLGSDENVVNLSRAFYPPQTNPAEFIAVTYQYENETTGELQGAETWFWATSGSYFLHPLHVYSYLSILFDKPEPYFAQTVHVTLNASCMGAQKENMILLTHRLKTYVQQQEVNANIDDTYNAMVADRDEVSKKIRAENNRLTNVIITLQVTLVVFVAALLVTVLLLRRYYTNVLPQRRCNETKINNIKQQSTIISISIVSFHLLIYILALDGVALYNRENPPDQEINAIYQNEEPGDPFSILYNLPLIVMTFDIIAALFSFLMLVTAILHRSVRIFKPEKKKLSKRWVLFLRLSSVGPVLSFLMHAPFVTNAYLNDAFHASSIFIYYSVSIFVGFLLLKQVAIYTCLSSVWYAKREKTIHMDNTKVILSCGELNFKKNGSGFVQSVQIAGGNLTLNCNEAKLVRKSLILVNDNHIKVREGQLTLSINNKLKTNLVNTDSDEELHIEGGSLQVQQMWGHGDEEAATDVESYGTKVKLGKGGTLKVHVAYNEINGQHCFVVKGGELVGKDLRCMCFTKWLNTVSGAAICFILTTIVMALLFLSLLAILACYFVLIPINMSISNAGNRLIGVYQSFFVIVGALFAYKTLFKSEQSKSESNPIEQAVKRRKMPFTENAQGAEWGSLPDKEKVDEFYRVVVDIVAQHYTKLHGQ